MWKLSFSLEKFKPGGGQWKKEPWQELRDTACVLSLVPSQLCSSTCSPFCLSKVTDLDQDSLPTVLEPSSLRGSSVFPHLSASAITQTFHPNLGKIC